MIVSDIFYFPNYSRRACVGGRYGFVGNNENPNEAGRVKANAGE